MKRSKNASRSVLADPKQRIIFRMGKRLYLRPVIKDDLPFLTVSINDPDITQFLSVLYPQTQDDESGWYADSMKHKSTDIVFALVLRDTDEMIGIMGLHRIEPVHGLATTGSFIGRKDLWSKGYGHEAKMLLLDYAFNTLNLRKICSMVYDFNGRSARCLEKCGYVQDGVHVAHKFKNGHYCDEHQYAVFREGFEPLWKKFQKEVLGRSKAK